MERVSVYSSNIAEIGYDEKNKILEVQFNNGSVYQYLNVPYGVYDELMNSNSKGSFFSASIRNVYTPVKL